MSDTRVSRPGSTQSGRDSGTDIHVSLKQTEFFKVADDTLLLSRGKGMGDEPIKSLGDVSALPESINRI